MSRPLGTCRLSAFVFVLATMPGYAESLSRTSVPFYSSIKRAQHIRDAAISPDGTFVAIATSDPDLTLVRIADGTVIKREAYGDYGGLAFSPDGKQLLNLSHPVRVFDGKTLARLKQISPPPWPGTTGIVLEQRNGKLLVAKLLEDSPAAKAKDLTVGDEVIAFAQGPQPLEERLDFDTEWKKVLGWSVEKAAGMIDGTPGTNLRIGYIPKGQLQPQEILLDRVGVYRGANGKTSWARFLFTKGQRLAATLDHGTLVLRQSPTAVCVGGIRPINVRPDSVWIFSPDNTVIGIAGYYRGNGGGLGMEIHSLLDSSLVATADIPSESAWCGAFTPDNKQLAIGTQDSVEVFDIKEKKWVRQIPFFKDGQRDKGVKTPGGPAPNFAIDSTFLETHPKTIFVNKAKVRRLAISKDGLLAAGGGDGVMRLLDFATGETLSELPPQNKDDEVQRIDFTPDGSRLLYFVPGALHIVDVKSLHAKG